MEFIIIFIIVYVVTSFAPVISLVVEAAGRLLVLSVLRDKFLPFIVLLSPVVYA
jgi:hypothetical protein